MALDDKVLSGFYFLHINGQALSLDRRQCVTSISIDSTDNGSDTCTIKVIDPNFQFIEDDIFINEATVYVEYGWENVPKQKTFFGYISAIDLSFPESGSPELSIFCLDSSHIMNREKKTRSWSNTTSAEVVKSIAREYGFGFTGQHNYTFTKQGTISQSNATDIEFCEDLASKETVPFKCKLIGNSLFYVKRNVIANASAKLYYKDGSCDIQSFTPKINKETKQVKISKGDINASTKLADYAYADDSTPRDLQGKPVKTLILPKIRYFYDWTDREWKFTMNEVEYTGEH